MHKECVSAYHKEVENFKKQLIQTALEAHDGNRTHAARSLGLQRTYLLRLLREFAITEPRPMRRSAAMVVSTSRR